MPAVRANAGFRNPSIMIDGHSSFEVPKRLIL